MIFADVDEVHRAYEGKFADLHAAIRVRIKDVEVLGDGECNTVYKRVQSTVGRAILSRILPEGMPYSYVNKPMTKKAISKLINLVLSESGTEGNSRLRGSINVYGFLLFHTFRCIVWNRGYGYST